MVEYSTVTGLPLKPCKKGYERNPVTNRCRKICKPRNATPKSAPRAAKPRAAKRAKAANPRAVKRAKAAKPKTWEDVIRSWKAGKCLPDIRGSVFWETSAIRDGGEVEYKEETVSASSALPMSLRALPSQFEKHLKKNLTG